MKKMLTILFILVILSSLHLLLSRDEVGLIQSAESPVSIPEYSPNEVIVKFKEDVRAESILLTIESLQGKIVTYLGRELTGRERVQDDFSNRSFTGDSSLFLIKIPEYIGTDQAISLLRFNPEIEYVERNYALVPVSIDDQFYDHQWALNNSGQSGGTPDADIDAPEAWALSTGSVDIIVAVIDGGIDYLHPDLAENLWINPGEWGADGLGGEKQYNNIDDDHNGYVDDWRGWHFNSQVPLSEKNDPMPDNFDHATIIGGVIGAAWKVLYDPSNPSTPNAPTNLGATPTSWYTIELYWQDNSTNEVGFEIQRCNDDKPVFLRHASVSQNIHAFNDQYAYTRGPGAGISHSYRVRAGNLGGMSTFSNVAIATIPHTNPAAPSNLYAQSPTFVSVPIHLNWEDNANNESGFVIETCKEGIGIWTELATPGVNENEYYIIMGESSAGTYYYRIKAQNPLGSSVYSNELTIVVEAYEQGEQK